MEAPIQIDYLYLLYFFPVSSATSAMTSQTGARALARTGIGADDIFQLMIVWRATDSRDETEVRLANTLRATAVSITITSLTEMLAFCIGATSPFLCVRNFCACSGMVGYIKR